MDESSTAQNQLKLSHEGRHNGGLENRLNKYGKYINPIAENIYVGNMNIQDILINWLIDDGDKNRKNRMNLFNSNFQFIGIQLNPFF